MERQELIKLFENYRESNIEIKGIEEEIKKLRERMLFLTAQNISGMPGGSNISKPVEKSVLALQESIEKYSDKILEVESKRKEIEQIIETVESPTDRTILRERFVKSNNLYDISKFVFLSDTTIKNRQAKALTEIIKNCKKTK